jgi:hypothetical protein
LIIVNFVNNAGSVEFMEKHEIIKIPENFLKNLTSYI